MKIALAAFVAALVVSATAFASLDPTRPGEPRVRVIDVHTHIFNGKDLPLRGILAAYNAPDEVAQEIENFLLSDENRTVAAKAADLQREAKGKISRSWPDLLPAPRSFLMQGLRLTERQQAVFRRYLGEEVWSADLKSADRESFPPALVVVARVLDQAGFFGRETGEQKLVPATDPVRRSKVEFVWLMLHSHEYIFRSLYQEYPNADLFVHLMMDMEMAYGHAPSVRFADQHKLMRDIDQAAGGRLLNFTAFDPFRRDQAQASVEQGLDFLAVGAKVYPASGYRAWDNKAFPPRVGSAFNLDQWDSRYAPRNDNWSPAELNAVLIAFFKWSAQQNGGAGLPLFAHCTPDGFEAMPGYGWMANPKFWALVLEEVPNLRLCLGHAGGEDFWFSAKDYADTDNSTEARRWRFGRDVVRLCQRYPNVYCEVGYLEKILDFTKEPIIAMRIQNLLQEPAKPADPNSPGWRFGDKIMYGTDWHMLYKEDGAPDYLKAFDDMIRPMWSGSWHRKFFAANAVNFLRLDALAKDTRYSQVQRDYWAKLVAEARYHK